MARSRATTHHEMWCSSPARTLAVTNQTSAKSTRATSALGWIMARPGMAATKASHCPMRPDRAAWSMSASAPGVSAVAMRLGHRTPQPRRIVGKAMKAAEANPAAYVTRREVPSAWRTRATQPIGHTSAASTIVATLVPGSTSATPGRRLVAIHEWKPLG
ncbi:MAG: hypothetical protein JF622_04165 [Terrabacter sp.]|nr:hypothetical protein [Terrabacter sp.]